MAFYAYSKLKRLDDIFNIIYRENLITLRF